MLTAARSLALPLAVAILAGCGDGNLLALDGGSRSDAGVGGRDATPAPSFAGTIALPFAVDVDWSDGAQAAGPLSAVSLHGDVGSLTFRGESLPAIAFERIPFGGFTLAMIAATSRSDVVVAYAYCLADGTISTWYHEALDEPVTLQQPVNPGACHFSTAMTTPAVAFTPLVAPGMLLHDASATVQGGPLTVAGGSGAVTFTDGAQPWQVDVYATVDCRTGCGSPGWYELHSLLRDGPRAAVGIFYLKSDMPASVTFAYGLRLDAPSLLLDATLPATWSISP